MTNDEDGVAVVLERMLAEAASVDSFRRQLFATDGVPPPSKQGGPVVGTFDVEDRRDIEVCDI